MKLDQVPDKENTTPIKAKRSETHNVFFENNSTLLELLNPLKSVNLNSNLHSFYNFREMNKNVETILRTQSNIIYYVLHQNFMCDDQHKEFFKNMVGRFYDLPEWFWGYYQGLDYRESNSYKTMLGLVLLENKHYNKKYFKPGNILQKFQFNRIETEESVVNITHFNKLALEEYWGGQFKKEFSAYYVPFNKMIITDRDISDTREWEAISFDNDFEFGRMKPNSNKIKRKSEEKEDNYWFIATYDWISKCQNPREAISNYAIYASLGLDNFDPIINLFKERILDEDFDDDCIPKFTKHEKRIIRSLSQTFNWTKQYIYENENNLDLDVLGLNMTVPWDMELVKFFIERGYGGRMSENKSVFEKVFEPLLTDGILEKLFKCEYERYE